MRARKFSRNMRNNLARTPPRNDADRRFHLPLGKQGDPTV
jgi:hypothetical protein